MAKRVTDLTAMTTTPATGDVLVIVDVNDTTGSADGTSKKIDNKFFLQTDKITIDNTDFLAIHTDGRIIASSPGAGFAIIPISVYIENTSGGTPNENNLGLSLSHTNKSTDYYWDTTRYWPKTPSSGTAYDGISFIFPGSSPASKGICATSIEDKGFYLYAKDTGPTGGATNTMVVYFTYRIIDVS